MKEIAAILDHTWAWIGITDIAKEGNLVYKSNGQSIDFRPPWMDGHGEDAAIALLFLPLLHLQCLENELMVLVQALHTQLVNCKKLLNIIITKLKKYYIQNEPFNKS